MIIQRQIFKGILFRKQKSIQYFHFIWIVFWTHPGPNSSLSECRTNKRDEGAEAACLKLFVCLLVCLCFVFPLSNHEHAWLPDSIVPNSAFLSVPKGNVDSSDTTTESGLPTLSGTSRNIILWTSECWWHHSVSALGPTCSSMVATQPLELENVLWFSQFEASWAPKTSERSKQT